MVGRRKGFKLKTAMVILTMLFIAVAQNQTFAKQNTIVNDISDLFTYYNSDTKRYEPFDKSVNSRKSRIHITNSAGTGQILVLFLPKDASLSVNGKYLGTGSAWNLNLDSLQAILSSNSLQITVDAKSRINLSELKAELISPLNVGGELGDPIQLPRQDQADQNSFVNFLITATVVLLYGFGLLFRKFPKDTADYLAIYRSFEFKNRDEGLTGSKPFTRTNLLFISLSSFLISLVLVAMAALTNGRIFNLLFDPKFSFWPLVASWSLTAVIVFILTISKYVLINILSVTFNINEFKSSQFFNSYRVVVASFAICLICITVFFLTFRAFEVSFYTLVINGLIIILGVRILFIFFKLRDFSSHRNFYLILYLCVTEIIPFLALYKVVLG